MIEKEKREWAAERGRESAGEKREKERNLRKMEKRDASN